MLQGIPENADVPPVAQAPTGGQAVNPPVQASGAAAPAVPSGGGPNANPLDLFPQVRSIYALLDYVVIIFSIIV